MSKTRYRVFVAVTPGLEPVLHSELTDLFRGGGETRRLKQLNGGVEVLVPREDLWQMAHFCRVGESLRVRVGQFAAHNFAQLEKGLSRIPWAAYLARGSRPQVKVTCRRSALYHSGAVDQRVSKVLSERLGAPGPGAEPASSVFVRIVRDRAQVSIDASGERLHRRGYRIEVGTAPLRETLAAACLRVAGLGPETTLWDPFCGAGTVPLEALAARAGDLIVAGRTFAFETWPTHDPIAYRTWVDGLRAGEPDPRMCVYGSDVDATMVEVARRNAARTSLNAHCRWIAGDFEKVVDQIPPGAAIVTNAPYGRRLSRATEGGQPGPDDSRSSRPAGHGQNRGKAPPLPDTEGRSEALVAMFRRFGAMLGQRTDLDPVFVLNGHRGFVGATRLTWQPVLRFKNRGLPVVLLELDRSPRATPGRRET